MAQPVSPAQETDDSITYDTKNLSKMQRIKHGIHSKMRSSFRKLKLQRTGSRVWDSKPDSPAVLESPRPSSEFYENYSFLNDRYIGRGSYGTIHIIGIKRTLSCSKAFPLLQERIRSR